ncbi:MAG: DUF4091 domain-containing protein [Phycisphaerae bacterium]|nr:DUF4091 domain-containing protein [Phycisphaerae bacterium]
MNARITVLMLFLCAMATASSAQEPQMLEIWPVDPLVKVFRDATPDKAPELVAEVARGEHASLQIVVRSKSDVAKLTATLAPLTLQGGNAVLQPRPPRFVGYVPVDRPTQTPSKDQLRKTPADYPDPLLEAKSIDVKAANAQPIWITVPIPQDAAPGLYRGQVNVTAQIAGKQVTATQPVAVHVYKATVKQSRLWVTNWFAMHARHMRINPKPESDEYYALLRRYARNMADHRQNVALIPPLSLATFTPGPDGKLQIDFSRFDRWVEIFKQEGVIGLIEGGHIGGRKAGWESPFVVQTKQIKDGKVVTAAVDPASPEADAFFAQFFPALVKHLRDKGWLKSYVQHLADEPIKGNIDTYRAMAKLARKYAPELRIIEACHTKDLTGAMDVWVPQLNFLHHDFNHYQERQRAGDEVWFYTCVFPQGEYANRFIELPLIKTRLLHWINFKYGITGYLHWGYNHWTDQSPFTHTTRPHGGPPYLPAGDAWIVYPGTDGPLDSIRHEAMRDGIADYELLCQLADRAPSAAKDLAAKHILDFDRYETDVPKFRATRREIIERLSSP